MGLHSHADGLEEAHVCLSSVGVSSACACDGDWEAACIKDGTLTWNEGEDVELTILSHSRFCMSYFAMTGCPMHYEAELRNDGKLHWSDGDVWMRSECSNAHGDSK